MSNETVNDAGPLFSLALQSEGNPRLWNIFLERTWRLSVPVRPGPAPSTSSILNNSGATLSVYVHRSSTETRSQASSADYEGGRAVELWKVHFWMMI
jgi:hypothetical protein